MVESILSPISIAFIAIIVGCVLGKIKVFGISLNLAGVLIVSIALGYAFASADELRELTGIASLKDNIKMFSSLGTALFVSVIGITTGYSLDFNRGKKNRSALVGIIMALTAFVMMGIILKIDENISLSKLIGALCGALTTTPGLSAANELESVIAEEATLGYGCTYLFGVIATVLFVQIITRKCEAEVKSESKYIGKNQNALMCLIQIGLTVVFGSIIGAFRIVDFSLGNSGGVLCFGIALGAIVNKFLPNLAASKDMMNVYRTLGLVLFFAGNGISAGTVLSTSFDIKIILYGALMTVVSIIVGVIILKLVFKGTDIPSVIAGGMTSTPAAGILLQKGYRIDLGEYSIAYVSALITIVILAETKRPTAR